MESLLVSLTFTVPPEELTVVALANRLTPAVPLGLVINSGNREAVPSAVMFPPSADKETPSVDSTGAPAAMVRILPCAVNAKDTSPPEGPKRLLGMVTASLLASARLTTPPAELKLVAMTDKLRPEV